MKDRRMSDTISRQAAIDALWKALYEYEDKTEKQFQESEDLDVGDWIEHRIFVQNMNDIDRQTILNLPSAQPEQRWIPFKTRPLTKEEKEEHPEWDGILDCKLPDDGQRILVNVSVRGHESVQYDEFYTDDGSYLDSGYEIGTEATAWMPLPEPYREEKDRRMSDTISRQAAITALIHMCSEDKNGITVSRANVDSMLKSLLPAQPEPERTMEEFMYGQDMGNPEDGSL